jgi:predicted RecB family nuclease
MAVRGITDAMILPLLQAGITDVSALLAADAKTLSESTGIPKEKISEFQAAAKRMKDRAIIQI